MMRTTCLTLIACTAYTHGAFSESLFTQSGSDPTFEQLLKTHKLQEGHNSKQGVISSKINVNLSQMETTPEARRPIAHDILIHNLENSAIHSDDCKKWSRWYQESGHTQVFRLFKGEENVRKSRELAARIEAFSKLSWGHGAWHVIITIRRWPRSTSRRNASAAAGDFKVATLAIGRLVYRPNTANAGTDRVANHSSTDRDPATTAHASAAFCWTSRLMRPRSTPSQPWTWRVRRAHGRLERTRPRHPPIGGCAREDRCYR